MNSKNLLGAWRNEKMNSNELQSFSNYSFLPA
jgi:hypothetical protein